MKKYCLSFTICKILNTNIFILNYTASDTMHIKRYPKVDKILNNKRTLIYKKRR